MPSTDSPTPPGPRAPLSWSGWGDPERAAELPEALRGLLQEALGVKPGRPVPASPASVRLTEPGLPDEIRAQLAGVVGAEHVHGDHEARVRHLGGKSTIDLLALRGGELAEPLAAPDLVLTPAGHDEVQALLELCARHGVAVVPFGGGTSVVGGLSPVTPPLLAGTVVIDLARLNALCELDEQSRLAVLQPGLRGPEAETLLAGHGYTLGHFPQSFQYATLGGFAAARSSGQASAGYGRFDERVLALQLATPAGTLSAGRAPRTAAGPDLRQLVLGSEGTLGVITELTLAISPAPAQRVYEGWTLPSFAQGTDVLRALAQDGPRPTVLRLSDEAESAIGLARPDALGDSNGGGCLAIVGWEGDAEQVAARRGATHALLRDAGGEPVEGAGESWDAGRYSAPYLRDALLDAGALVETLETVAFWSRLPELYEATSRAIRDCLTELGTPPVILCHISHVYAAGASLYFTVASAQAEDPIAQWRRVKAAAGDAILAAGGSISHHHGVGTEHRDHYAREAGALGIEALRAVKRTLDPTGILNPGILL